MTFLFAHSTNGGVRKTSFSSFFPHSSQSLPEKYAKTSLSCRFAFASAAPKFLFHVTSFAGAALDAPAHRLRTESTNARRCTIRVYSIFNQGNAGLPTSVGHERCD